MRHALRPTSPDAANKISFVFFSAAEGRRSGNRDRHHQIAICRRHDSYFAARNLRKTGAARMSIWFDPATVK
jgi:hypothetical protein